LGLALYDFNISITWIVTLFVYFVSLVKDRGEVEAVPVPRSDH
jgi:hypothetical protein